MAIINATQGLLRPMREKISGSILSGRVTYSSFSTREGSIKKSANNALMSSSRMPQKRGGTGWNCIYPTGLKVAQERPIFKVSSPGSYALSWIYRQSYSNFY